MIVYIIRQLECPCSALATAFAESRHASSPDLPAKASPPMTRSGREESTTAPEVNGEEDT